MSLTFRLNYVTLLEDVLSSSECSIVAVLTNSISVVVASSSVLSVISVTVGSCDVFYVVFPNSTFLKSVSQACAYQFSWVALTCGSGR